MHEEEELLDLEPVCCRLERAVERCALDAPGQYRRWTVDGPGRDLEANPYGCADAANLLYTLARLPEDAGRRAAHVDAIRSFQEPESGGFREPTHHPVHVTAHCVAALELFDARPRYPLRLLERREDEGAIEAYLDGLDWRDDPWHASHRGAGCYAARVVCDEASREFEDRYFAWLDAECDPDTGLWRRGAVGPPYRWGDSRFPHLAGTFHYLFNYEHARRAHPHPAALIETCLDIEARGTDWPLGRTVGFAEVDWVYCLSRAMRQSGHRRDEAMAALRAFSERYVPFLTQLDWERDDGGSDLHRLFGAACALAELQRALPGMLRSARPLRLVLDRRPFI